MTALTSYEWGGWGSRSSDRLAAFARESCVWEDRRIGSFGSEKWMRAVFLNLFSGQCERHWHVAGFIKQVIVKLRRALESLQILQVPTCRGCADSWREVLLPGANTCAIY